MKKILLASLLFFISASIWAQHSANPNSGFKIKGRLIDSTSKLPLEYATITLFFTGDKKPVNGSVTDNKGYFVVDNVVAGSYKLVAEFLGYQPHILSNLIINKDHP